MSGFTPNRNFVKDFEPELQRLLIDRAEAIAAHANSFANRIMPSDSGEQIRVVVDSDGVHVANFDHGGHIDEWGSVNSPPNAPLRRGIRAAGLPLDEISK